ncbi:MAG: tetratricopeptide repeat protein [Thermonemataceae bacterium]
MQRLCVILLLYLPSLLFAQNVRVDSLNTLLTEAEKEERVDVLCLLANELQHINPDLAHAYLDEAEEIATEHGYTGGQGRILHERGRLFRNKGDYPVASEYFFNALELYEKVPIPVQIGHAYNDIAIVYAMQQQDSTAIRYFQKAKKIFIKINDLNGQAQIYNNLASMYANWKQYEKAMRYYKKSLQMKRSGKDSVGIGNSLSNIASILGEMNKREEQLTYILASKKIFDDLSSHEGRVAARNHLAQYYASQGDYQQALTIALDGYQIALEHQLGRQKQEAAKEVYLNYLDLKNYEKALTYYKVYTETKDSLFNENTLKRIQGVQESYQVQKEREKVSLLEKAKALEAYQQRQTIIALVSGTILLIAILLITSYFLKRTNKLNKELKEKNDLLTQSNEEISLQREEIFAQAEQLRAFTEELIKKNDQLKEKTKLLNAHNEHVTASIFYAQRIQQAILPNLSRVEDAFSDLFVLYLPKDIVSGDFYWFSQMAGKRILAVGDCTGHGVPGAFMSLLGSAFLTEIIVKNRTYNPAEILSALHQNVQTTLRQDDSNNKDGMELGICVIDEAAQTLQYAGARFPLVYFVEGEMKLLKATNHSIGGGWEGTVLEKQFDLQTINLQAGMVFYLFSDGYRDQFNEKRKKFMMKRFKQLLSDIHTLPLTQQKEVLQTEHLSWKGTTTQVDDILVVGFQG